jgi:hypothetical protein
MTREEAIEILIREKDEDPFIRTEHREQVHEALDMAIEALEREPKWISAKERLPKNNEHIGNVCKYYLVQDEYGDMHVAHYESGKWFRRGILYPFEDDIVAWQELPKKYMEV